MPCRTGMRGCRASCQHRALVEGYRLARHAATQAREPVTKDGDTENRDYGPLVTFKDWLVGHRERDVDDGR